MNTTWKLWRALKHPLADHPLFLRVAVLPPSFETEARRNLMMTVLAVLLLPGLCVLLTVAPGIIVAVFAMPILYVVFNGMIFGMVWAARISSAITREQQQQTYDVLSMTPAGALGAHWLISTGCVHRSGGFNRLQVISPEEFFISTLAAIALSVERSQHVYVESVANIGLIQFLMIVVYVVVFLVAFYLNHIQSVLNGVLIGMLIPSLSNNRLDSQLYAFGTYLLLQFATLALIATIVFGLLPGLLPQRDILSNIVIALLGLGVFYVVREAVIRALWVILTRHLNSNMKELETLTHFRL